MGDDTKKVPFPVGWCWRNFKQGKHVPRKWRQQSY
ncbi:uncharacterized protein G2W53_038039 [Senna tora]|uniref:Uncharacterized protein n=1 Tax=Senna tora TaxID=362788 RepID=A0A834W1Q5_9FABA|nr:uncharacterized protein G2W53_038039 [Senna tora]